MISIPFEKRSLGNGLEVITHVDRNAPMVAVNIWYHVGSKNESPGRTGFAHLFEHVMFEGSKNHNKDYFEPLQRIGGNINGSTTNDRTNYWEDLPSNYLPLALWLESDRMGFLLDALDQERFDLQRDVVKNERRQSYENRPYGMAHLKLQEALFPLPHPYNWPTIGSQEDLDSATLKDVQDFFRSYYSPSNASITIAGDIDHNEAYDQVEKYFGELEPGPSIDRFQRMGSGLQGKTIIEMEDSVQLPRLYLAWPSSPDFTERQAALDMLSIILSDGRSSRLNNELVYESNIAHEIRAFHHGQEIAGEFHITATAAPDNTLESIENVIWANLDKISSDPPSESEMERARNRVQNYQVRQLEKIGGFGGRADQLNYYNVLGKDPSLINTDLDRYMAVTPQQIASAASSLNQTHVRLTVIPSASNTSTSISSSFDRKKAPSKSGEVSFTPPVPEKSELANGTKILLVHKPNLPITSVGLLLKTGAMNDPHDSPGLAKFTTDMLVEGTSSKTSYQIADEIEFLGSQLSKDVAREYTILSVSGLSIHLEKELSLLSDVAQHPSFPVPELKRLLAERLADLSTIEDNADLIANIASRSILYGESSAYGHPVNGTLDSVNSISQEAVNQHFKKFVLPSNRTFLVVGDTNMDEAARLIEQSFRADDPRDSEPAPSYPGQAYPKCSETTIHLIDRPGAAQSVIRAGHLTIPRMHDDYYALAFLNYVLGGDYSGRLNMNLRQDKGYSYGFYSSIMWHSVQSPWLARGSVQSEFTKESVYEVLKELSDLRSSRPISEKEFNHAKQGLIKGIPSQFETNSQIMGQLVNLSAFELPDNYFQQSIEKLESLEFKDVLRASKEHINDTGFQVVVVGDKEKIHKGLKDLSIPVLTTDIYGNRC